MQSIPTTTREPRRNWAFRAGARVAHWPIVRGYMSGAEARKTGFRDDGGTRTFRDQKLRRRIAPLWFVLRVLWIFPLVALVAAFTCLFGWFLLAILLGEPWCRANWGWIVAIGLAISYSGLGFGKGDALGSGPLWFRGMVMSPSQGAWGSIATMFRSFFVFLYGSYAASFWVITGCVIWLEWPAITKLLTAG